MSPVYTSAWTGTSAGRYRGGGSPGSFLPERAGTAGGPTNLNFHWGELTGEQACRPAPPEFSPRRETLPPRGRDR